MALLAVAQEAACAAYLQIAHGDAEPGAEGGKLPDGGKPLGGDLGQHLVARKGEIRIRLAGRTPHAAAYLVKLRQAHPVGVLDNERVAVAHINAGLDQGGTDKDVDLIVQQLLPHRGDLLFGHLAVGDADARAGDKPADPGGTFLNVIDPVVQVVDLPAAGQLLADGLGNDALIIFQHIGLDGLALKGRLLDRAHVPYAGQCHVQRAGDRRGGQGEHIHTDKVLL